LRLKYKIKEFVIKNIFFKNKSKESQCKKK